MPRLFSGIEIPEVLGDRLATLRSGLWGARWIDPENYHVTLRFIGDVDDRVACEFADQLAEIRAPAFELRFDGLGSFGGRKPRALWAGIDASEPLTGLQRAHERAAPRRRSGARVPQFSAPCNAGASARPQGGRGGRLPRDPGPIQQRALRGPAVRAVFRPRLVGRRSLCGGGGVSPQPLSQTPLNAGSTISNAARPWHNGHERTIRENHHGGETHRRRA